MILMKFCVCSIVTSTWNFPECFNKSGGPWLMLKFQFLEIMNGFDKILFMHWYTSSVTCIWSMLWLIHIIFPNLSTELWPLIDCRIMFMLNILWNNCWIWSNLVVTLIFFCAKSCATTKISALAGYHVVLATLLLVLSRGSSYEHLLKSLQILH